MPRNCLSLSQTASAMFALLQRSIAVKFGLSVQLMSWLKVEEMVGGGGIPAYSIVWGLAKLVCQRARSGAVKAGILVCSDSDLPRRTSA